jgi:hypothetical protein
MQGLLRCKYCSTPILWGQGWRSDALPRSEATLNDGSEHA